MFIQKTTPIQFGYHTHIKDCWMAGKLPSVTHGLYGFPLTKKTVSNEHLIPHSLGGSTEQGNIALANKHINNLRGDKPLNEFLTRTQLVKYLKQFQGVIVEFKHKIFNGDDYIADVLTTTSKLDLKV